MISFVLIGFSILIFILSLELGFGEIQNPGPGFMPIHVSVVIFVLSLLVLVMEMGKSDKDEGGGPSIIWKNFKKPVFLVIVLSGYTLFLEVFGYLIDTFLLMFLTFSISMPKKWYMNMMIAAIIASLSFLVFYKCLRMQLPTGLFRILR